MERSTGSSGYQVLVECSSLSPLDRTDLQVFLERQPGVERVTSKLHVTDALLNPETHGLVAPRFDLVVHLAIEQAPGIQVRELGATITRKVEKWMEAHRPRSDSRAVANE
jgi:hypothetical protein